MKKRVIKVAVTGAAGQIGYALLYRIASGQMFGYDCEVELQLLELETSKQALTGVVMELEDCGFPLLKNIVCTSDLSQAMKDANWVLLIGSVPRKQGMERSDLLEINGSIFASQGKAINDFSASDVKVLVVGNPCNTNALIAMHHAKDVPNDRFYAMTMLDELRAKAQLAKKASMPVSQVSSCIIWGNHSATQYPDFYNTKLDGQNVLDIIKDESWLQNNFVETVQKRGAEIIKARGLSSAASAANAIIATVNSMILDTKRDDCFSLSRCSNGEYDIDEGLIFSFPCITKNNEIQVVSNFSHNEFGKQKIFNTLKELRQEKQAVKELKLI